MEGPKDGSSDGNTLRGLDKSEGLKDGSKHGLGSQFGAAKDFAGDLLLSPPPPVPPRFPEKLILLTSGMGDDLHTRSFQLLRDCSQQGIAEDAG